MKEHIRDRAGLSLGTVETLANGDKVARAFSGMVLGYYRKDRDVTTDFSGMIVARGDAVVSLIINYNNKI